MPPTPRKKDVEAEAPRDVTYRGLAEGDTWDGAPGGPLGDGRWRDSADFAEETAEEPVEAPAPPEGGGNPS